MLTKQLGGCLLQLFEMILSKAYAEFRVPMTLTPKIVKDTGTGFFNANYRNAWMLRLLLMPKFRGIEGGY
jgi:hypothetical protein